MKMKTIGVIPARYASTRFAAKVLADICGKPMIQHVWERARQSRKLDDLVIACDDERIMAAAKTFGARAILTSSEHRSGSDRIAEAVQKLKLTASDIIVNIQGDEPLIESSLIDALASALAKDKEAPVATAIKPITDPADFKNPNVVKAVIDYLGYALYFSRAGIPYDRAAGAVAGNAYKHLGIYAYRQGFLLEFTRWPSSKLEQIEQLEQLRILEAGYRIKTIVTDVETIGVDTQEDLKKVEQLIIIKGNQ